MKKIKAFLDGLSTKTWFAIMTVLAFGSVISFFQIDSAYGDEHNFNGFFGFFGIGIVLGLAAIYALYMVNKNSGVGKQE